jgi:hypothetical protein
MQRFCNWLRHKSGNMAHTGQFKMALLVEASGILSSQIHPGGNALYIAEAEG